MQERPSSLAFQFNWGVFTTPCRHKRRTFFNPLACSDKFELQRSSKNPLHSRSAPGCFLMSPDAARALLPCYPGWCGKIPTPIQKVIHYGCRGQRERSPCQTVSQHRDISRKDPRFGPRENIHGSLKVACGCETRGNARISSICLKDLAKPFLGVSLLFLRALGFSNIHLHFEFLFGLSCTRF